MYKIKVHFFIVCFLFPQLALSFNVDGRFSNNAASAAIEGFEKSRQMGRDSLGRKLIISPNSKIDPDSVTIQMAPRSTVILNVRQYNRGKQMNNTPYRYNTEIMEE